jgi:hypothetical protein
MNAAGTPPDRPPTPVDRRTSNVPYAGPDRRKVNLPPAEWSSTVKEVMEHVEEQREARPAPPVHRSWQPVILSALAVILCVVGAWNIVAWQESQRPAFSQQKVADGVRATMFMTVMDLEAHRSRTGDYPRTLEEAGFHHPELSYRRTGEGYVLEGQTFTTPIVYVSGEDLSRFEQSLDLVLVASGDDS